MDLSDSGKEKYLSDGHIQHAEHAVSSHIQIDDAFLNPAEHVAYGKTGVRGLIGSPYIFGAALLASMGGFSFGYDQ